MFKSIATPLAALAFAGLSMASSPARAEIAYPWCVQYSDRTGGGTNCGFVSLAQCQATLSGMVGICYENPRYGYTRPPTKKHVAPAR